MNALAVLRHSYEPDNIDPIEMEALRRQVREEFQNIVDQISADIPGDLIDDVLSSEDPRDLYETIAFNIPADYRDKQQLLTLDTLGEKLNNLLMLLAKEKDILDLEIRIHETVQNAVNQNQREFYIREQIRALQDELGDNPDMMGDADEIEDYRRRIMAIVNISDEARTKLSDELDKLAKMPSYSQEAALLRSYLDTCLALPWDNFDEETADVENAERILDEDHYGIRKVKERVLENIEVRALTPDVRGQIICLYGPPVTGKTRVAKSIARALNRKYVRVSLGGVRDESDIRGHRKTYIGAMPGRIIAGMRQAGVMNPVMLLDEIDKMSNDFRGDPSSAMLEVLDSEQNTQFVDHYVEIPFDLSRVLFITTANSLDTIQPPLLDRMEVIELTSYTREEKFHIAREHLIPKQMKKFGIKTSQMRINDSAVYAMIDSYTREAGVRKLEREIAKLCRKTAKALISGESKVSFKAANIEEYLGHKRYTEDFYMKKPSVGCVNGLAWTSVGGVIMPLEALVLEGKGKIEL
ncbi:MAG: AAA family ATPase, partial [Ruminococcus sp.]|nr:AAA family ATPase [Ruminococcus sp.]